jgi:hypothetical protein
MAAGTIDYNVIGSDPSVQDLSFKSFFIPQEGFVSVESISEGEIVGDGVKYFFINKSTISDTLPYAAVLSYDAVSQVTWLNDLELISDVDYPSEMEDYLAYDEYVNPSQEMEIKASELVEGVKYKAEAVLRILDFVHNHVTYDLNVGGDYLLKASWVYENAVGTCDEYSVLAAALLRSIRIPVRFVHGYVKSDRLGGYGPHSYLEVYLSGEWLPFDPTWSQYGLVDISHINFMTSASPVFLMSSVSYKYRDVSITANNPVISITMDDFEEQEELFTISGGFDREKYYENDYAVLTLTIDSPSDDPVILPLKVTTTKTLEPVNPMSYVLVKGSRALRLVFKTPQTNPPGVIHPVVVKTPFSNEVRFNVTNLDGNPLASYADVEAFLNNSDLVENPGVSVRVDFDSEFYGYSSLVNVTLVNTGNTILKGLRVVMPAQNFSHDFSSIGINKNKTVMIPVSYSEQGVREEAVFVYQNNVLLDSYSFSNENIEVPEVGVSASYNVSGDHYNLTVLLYSNTDLAVSVLNISSDDYHFSTDFHENSSFLIPVGQVGINIDLELLVVDSFGEQYSYPLRVEVQMSLLEKIIYYIKKFIRMLLYS